MARRFSNIRRGRILNQALTNLRAYEDAAATRVPDVGGGTARGPSVRVSIIPFGRDLGAGEKALITVTQRSRTIMSGPVGARATTDPGIKIGGFSPAKIVLKQGTGTATAETSRLTGIRYLRQRGESYTHGFGGATATEKEMEAFSQIQSALLSAGANRSVSYQPERFRQTS